MSLLPQDQSIAAEQILYTAAQVRELDRLAIAGGITGIELMTRAGLAAFREVQQRWLDRSPIEVFCGGGNNGGDGYIIAALAKENGLSVRAWALADPGSLKGDAALAVQRAVDAGVVIRAWQGEEPNPDGVIVDALLGTGLNGVVREKYAQAISIINASAAPVLAIDVPSGLCSDTGSQLGGAVRASATISFIGRKRGLYTLDGVDCAGGKVFDSLAVPRDVYQQLDVAAVRVLRVDGPSMLSQWGERPRGAHKGMFGHVLVIGGDLGMAGASLLAATAAARGGAGLVSCITRPEHSGVFIAARPELMVHGLSCEQLMSGAVLNDLIEKASVIVIGPGLGLGEWGQMLLNAVLNSDKPLVIDADALNLLAQTPEILHSHRGPRILTPHPGEAARLLACGTAELQCDRFASVLALRDKYQATVLLKGAGTLIADAECASPIYLNSGGNPGMATGGMGDVLSGVIAAFVAQGHAPAAATCLAAAVHSAAADCAARQGERGMLASDVIDNLRGVINGYAAVS
ncbi:NAD(P)H-hydrate dehydratase [Zhongshania aliphaticivorans]|uniref:NAD(P)H-hydrate dehydratase n=1 Tax=Zhongshania aliphaticivorans TaxID=1470434 RepID=UPI0012E63038|nr:NAD(P)H-hydrate dehydratase [Zhongshania aliphaticivorans]CAA0094541.1 Bifunctional NAD(P)H-hydrate repair enzyme Nnr [Zhongshania aliphaticivorans]